MQSTSARTRRIIQAAAAARVVPKEKVSEAQWESAGLEEKLVKIFGSSEKKDLYFPTGKPPREFIPNISGVAWGCSNHSVDMNGKSVKSNDKCVAANFDAVTYGFLVTALVKSGQSNIGDAIHLMPKVYDAVGKLIQDNMQPQVQARLKEMDEEMDEELMVKLIAQGRIKVAQWILRVSSEMSYISCLRKDKFWEEMKKNGKQVDVQYYYEDGNTPTGTCAVCVIGFERSLIENLIYHRRYKLEHWKRPENWTIVEKAKYFYISGFFLMVSPEFVQLVAEHAVANKKVFTMNLSASFICEFFKDAQVKSLPYVDIVFGNETEARTFSKVHGWETNNVEEIAVKISNWPKALGKHKRITVITRGADPVCVAEDGNVKLYPVIKLLKEKLVDTNGAGDAFVGGFLSQLVQEKSIEECVRAGCYGANVIIQMCDSTYPEKSDFN